MKKLLILLAVSALCVACSSSDDTPSLDKNLLIGNWYISNEQGYSYFDGEREDYDDSYTKENTWQHLEFQTDGTLISSDTEDTIEPIVTTFKWSLSGHTLTIKDEDGAKEKSTIKSLTATTLTLFEKGVDEDGPYEDTITFTKIN